MSSYLTVRCIPSRGMDGNKIGEFVYLMVPRPNSQFIHYASTGTTCQPTMGNVNLVGDRRYFSSKKRRGTRRGTRPNCEPIDVSEKGWYWCMMVCCSIFIECT